MYDTFPSRDSCEDFTGLETMCQRINGQKSFHGLAIDKFNCHLSIISYATPSPPPPPKKRRKTKGNTKIDAVRLNYRIYSVKFDHLLP